VSEWGIGVIVGIVIGERQCGTSDESSSTALPIVIESIKTESVLLQSSHPPVFPYQLNRNMICWRLDWPTLNLI
jgi:hypothetical protein